MSPLPIVFAFASALFGFSSRQRARDRMIAQQRAEIEAWGEQQIKQTKEVFSQAADQASVFNDTGSDVFTDLGKQQQAKIDEINATVARKESYLTSGDSDLGDFLSSVLAPTAISIATDYQENLDKTKEANAFNNFLAKSPLLNAFGSTDYSAGSLSNFKLPSSNPQSINGILPTLATRANMSTVQQIESMYHSPLINEDSTLTGSTSNHILDTLKRGTKDAS